MSASVVHHFHHHGAFIFRNPCHSDRMVSRTHSHLTGEEGLILFPEITLFTTAIMPPPILTIGPETDFQLATDHGLALAIQGDHRNTQGIARTNPTVAHASIDANPGRERLHTRSLPLFGPFSPFFAHARLQSNGGCLRNARKIWQFHIHA